METVKNSPCIKYHAFGFSEMVATERTRTSRERKSHESPGIMNLKSEL